MSVRAAARARIPYGHDVHISAPHARVLACLVEKAETTPDNYPLSTNALRAGCNQTTNRDPIVDYSERDVDAHMLELRQMGLARTVTGDGHRVGKHRHIVDEALGLDGHELAVLAVLVLRGDQTRNEITTRTARYARGPAGDADAVDAAIDRLAARDEPMVRRLDRRPGEREPRIAQIWAERASGSQTAPPTDPSVDPSVDEGGPAAATVVAGDQELSLMARVAALEATVADQERRITELIEQLGG